MAHSGQDDLQRELGFWDALTIGAGTMIGAGIFLLAGVALELTGPAAIFSYLAAGLVCMITAASAAELATGMPTSGGDYYFVSRSLGPALGAISGVGIWLSLTFAISFYLFGLGEYLAQLLPVTPFWGAVGGSILLTGLNVYGAKESGKMQVVVVLTLMVILGGFCVLGAFNLEASNYTPFFPYGAGTIGSTTALVFVSFLGFVKIAAVAEEIKEPSKNLPRTLIGSVALVTLLYVVILLVIAGMFTQETIRDVKDPLTQAARSLMGPVGAGAMIFAGLLATISSANASIMASSRINLAMARDRMVPNGLASIHETLRTPHRAILLTGILATLFLLLESLEDLAKIASVLQLYSYAALNVGCIVLRVAAPKWYEPTYRTPLFPIAQGIAAIACLGIIVYSGTLAQIAILVLITASLAWYLVWGRGRVEIDHALPEFQSAWAKDGWKTLSTPAPSFNVDLEASFTPAEREINAAEPRHVAVALANPEHETALLRMGRFIATGRTEGGHVDGLHLVRVPLQTPLSTAREQFTDRPSADQAIAQLAEESTAEARGDGAPGGPPLQSTQIETVVDAAHDVFSGIVNQVRSREADLLLMGWQGGFSVGQIYNSPVQRILESTTSDVAILKDRGVHSIENILLPWGGGLHARLGLEIAARIAQATGATVTLLRVVREGVDESQETKALAAQVAELVGDTTVRYLVQHADSVTEGIDAALRNADPDLVVIGAAQEWTLRQVLVGSIPDVVADSADCSVLMVRRYIPDTLSVKASEGFKRLKESAGLTTSPEN